jgi:hypothetical protein
MGIIVQHLMRMLITIFLLGNTQLLALQKQQQETCTLLQKIILSPFLIIDRIAHAKT